MNLCDMVVPPLFVTTVTPMKRGLKAKKNNIIREVRFEVTTVTPMKRGLKAKWVSASTIGIRVTTVTPMKRGLKVMFYHAGEGVIGWLQPLPR